jgi:glycosyltransferase involved in cell wall biosynthesis
VNVQSVTIPRQRRLRVLQVAATIAESHGGPPVVALELCRELRDRGHHSNLVTTDADGSGRPDRLPAIRRRAADLGFKIRRFHAPRKLMASLGLWSAIRRELKTRDVRHQLVDAHSEGTSMPFSRNDRKLPIGVIVMTKNEELAIEHCLQSVQQLAEVFVVDSGSEDETRKLAEQLGAHVVDFNWDGRYPKKKQWSLENCSFTGDWVLYLDADEMVSPELLRELQRLDLANSSHAAFQIPLDYVFLNKRMRHGHKVVKTALVNRHKCRFPVMDDLGVTQMGEVEGHYQPLVDGSVGKLRSTIVHHDREPLFHYFERHNRYSDWEAALRDNRSARAEVAKARSGRGQLFDRLPGKPLLFVIYSLLLRGGWRDGRAGVHYAIALAFYFWQIGVKRADRV